MKPDMIVPPPQMPCSECIEKCIKEGKVIPDVLVIVYCSHNQAGGIYNIQNQRWNIVTPISGSEFSIYINTTIKHANIFLDKALDIVFEKIPGKET